MNLWQLGPSLFLIFSSLDDSGGSVAAISPIVCGSSGDFVEGFVVVDLVVLVLREEKRQGV